MPVTPLPSPSLCMGAVGPPRWTSAPRRPGPRSCPNRRLATPTADPASPPPLHRPHALPTQPRCRQGRRPTRPSATPLPVDVVPPRGRRPPWPPPPARPGGRAPLRSWSRSSARGPAQRRPGRRAGDPLARACPLPHSQG